MTKRKLFIKKLAYLMKIQILVMVALVTVAAWGTYRIAEHNMRRDMTGFLDVYASQLENRIAGMDRILGILLYDNTDLQQIQAEDYLTRHYASLNLQRNIAKLLSTDTNAEFVIVAQSDYDICLMGGVQIPYEQREKLAQYTMALAEDDSVVTGGWSLEWIGEKSYICRNAIQNHRAVTVYLSVDTLLGAVRSAEDSARFFVWTDEKGEVFGTSGSISDIAKIKQADELNTGKLLAESHEVSEGKFRLYVCESKKTIYQRLSMELCVLLGFVILLYFFTLYVVKNVRKNLIAPMESLTEDMKKIREGDHGLRISEETETEEFYTLASSFNSLLDEIIHLRIQYYEKRLELQEADQKYIRLQLRPHFFLNAMTTVSALSAQNKNKEIQTYIAALSKNIRYMFSSGMHTVPVREEIRHVSNYLEMQELKYPDCVVSYIELPQELEKWEIPQMLIHTLVENEYRYAVSRNSMLMVMIKVSKAEYEDESMLLIEVEDDGAGYPEEVIRSLNGDSGNPSPDGTRVGLWSIRRLMELMYERKGLFRIGNAEPQGAVSRIYVPFHTVHEVKNSDTMNSGIE